MKRQANLIEKIAGLDNLYLAYWKAKRGKALKQDCIDYAGNVKNNILLLQEHIITGNLDIGHYSYFKIYGPKERVICAASFPERVLHHSIMNICHTTFEKRLIYHTYATRPNKGTHKAVKYAQKNTLKHKWYAKLDVKKYFDSINHSVLQKELDRLFKDRALLNIFEKIIASYQIGLGVGLPIGNLTSQYFANYYLSTADHFVIEKLHTPYLRYMDDMLLFGNNKEALKKQINNFVEFTESELKLNYKEVIINKTQFGVPFLGYRIFYNQIRLNAASKKRFRKKLFAYNNKLNNNIWSEKQYQEHILPLLDFVKFAASRGLRNNYIKKKGCRLQGSNRVNRGGSWNNNANNCRSANRNNNNPGNSNNNLGFRLACFP